MPENPIIIGYTFPPDSSVIKVLYIFQKVTIFPLQLHEFLRVVEKAYDPLQHGWV